jgi:hypothetical protein
MPSGDLSLDDLSAIMNLQRQEAFDEFPTEKITSNFSHDETAEDKLMKIVDAPLPGLPRQKEDLLRRAKNARRSAKDHRYSSGSMSMSEMNYSLNDKMDDSERGEWKRTISRSKSSTADMRSLSPPMELRRAISTVSGTQAGRQSSSTKRRVKNARQSAKDHRYSSGSMSMSETHFSLNDKMDDSERGEWKRTISRSKSSTADMRRSRAFAETATSDINSVTSSDTGTSERRGKRPSKFQYRSSSSTSSQTGGKPPRNISLSSDASIGTTDSSILEKNSNVSVSSAETNERGTRYISSGSNRSLSTEEIGKIDSDRSYSSNDRQGRQLDSTKDGERGRSVSSSRSKEGSSRKSLKKQKSKDKRGFSKDPQRRRKSSRSTDPESRRGRTRSSSKPRLDEKQDFDQIWDPNDQYKNSIPKKQGNGTSSSIKHTLIRDSGSKKKTKLQKIHELQAKCDRYKKEWIDASKEKKRYRKELQEAKIDVVSLTMEIDTHKTETGILRRQLTDSLHKLDETQKEQHLERNEYSEAVKEVAQARIDFTKALSEARERRLQMDKLEASLREKDMQVDSLQEEVDGVKKLIEELKLDLIHADDEGIRLESEIKRIQDELLMYKEAAEKDKDGTGGANLQRVHSDVEQKHQEEREQRIEEKQRRLDQKVQKFEEDRERSLQKQKEREQELAQRHLVESEKEKIRSEERKEMDDTINSRLKELESNNTALQGRLKSGQLETTIKLKKRDDTIEELQKILVETKKELTERDADPEGITSLQRDIESAKAETATVKEDLSEVQRLNGMLEEEIEDLQTGRSELQKELSSLKEETSSFTIETEKFKKKASEWERKTGEWTDKGKLPWCTIMHIYFRLCF